jgi:tRNA (guanine-N7-)-methyltransferase
MIIYHADPWPKKRHHKHRLFQHKFIDAISHVLKNDCLLKVSTDDENYKDWILTLFGERHDFENMYHDKFSSVPPIDHITTYFDKKKAMEGFETYFMLFKKIS